MQFDCDFLYHFWNDIRHYKPSNTKKFRFIKNLTYMLKGHDAFEGKMFEQLTSTKFCLDVFFIPVPLIRDSSYRLSASQELFYILSPVDVKGNKYYIYADWTAPQVAHLLNWILDSYYGGENEYCRLISKALNEEDNVEIGGCEDLETR